MFLQSAINQIKTGLASLTANLDGSIDLVAAAGKLTRIVGFSDKGGQVFNVAAYGSLSAAVAAAQGSGGTVLFPPGTTTVGSSTTIPSGIGIKLQNGALISVSSGVTLTLSCTIDAGIYQIFTGAGTVAITRGSVEYVLSEWWGARADGVVDCTSAINKASAALGTLGGGTIKFVPGIYNHSQLLYYSYVVFEGSGRFATRLRQNSGATTSMITAANPGSTTFQFSIRDLCLDGFNSQATTAGGLQAVATQNLLVERVFFNYVAQYCVKVQGGSAAGDVQNPVIKNCLSENCPNGKLVWLSPSDVSKPDGFSVLDNELNSLSATGLQIDKGPTSGPAPDGGCVAWNKFINMQQMIDTSSIFSRFVGNRFEGFASTGATNINITVRSGVWSGGQNGCNVFAFNSYHWTGTYSGSEPLNFVDTASIPSRRICEMNNKAGTTGDAFEDVLLQLYIGDKMLKDNGAGILQLLAQTASTATQLDIKGSAAGTNANVRAFNGPTESNPRFWAGYDNSLGHGAMWFGPGTAGLDTNLYRNAAGQLKTNGSLVVSGPMILASYTTATKPTASSVPAGSVIYVSDGGAGAQFQGSNGTSWVNLG